MFTRGFPQALVHNNSVHMGWQWAVFVPTLEGGCAKGNHMHACESGGSVDEKRLQTPTRTENHGN
jgi:hypothetical protein